MDIFEQLNAILSDINGANLQTAEELEAFRIQYLGTKNVLKPLFGEIKTVPNERKKEFGQVINTLKDSAEAKFAAVKETLDATADANEDSDLDLFAPGEPLSKGSLHPVNIVMNRIVEIFQRVGFAVVEGPEIESDWYNFTAMNTPPDHPARDMQDTFYIAGNIENLLRTHTSPVQARVMETQKPPMCIEMKRFRPVRTANSIKWKVCILTKMFLLRI
jgi:phenylalanyl-tRNA synthetase alpha chain